MTGGWMTTAGGQDHFLSGPDAVRNVIDINDIAWALAQQNRYAGHAKRPYSSAEHSLLTADLARQEGKSAIVQLACLMHDAHEAYTGDAIYPVKAEVGPAWDRFEHRQAAAVRGHFSLTTVFASCRGLIKHYDNVALATERRDLVRYDPRVNRPWFIDLPGAEVPPDSRVNLAADHLVATPWTVWRDCFLSRYFRLSREVQAAGQALMAPRETVCPGIEWPGFGVQPACLGCARYRSISGITPGTDWMTPPAAHPCPNHAPLAP